MPDDIPLSAEDLRAWQAEQLRLNPPTGRAAYPSSMREWDPSPIEKQKHRTQDLLSGVGSFAEERDIPFLRALDDPYYSRGVAESMTLASEFTPGLGDVQGIREGIHLTKEGHPILGPSIAGLSALPFLPAGITRSMREAAKRGLHVTSSNSVIHYTDPRSLRGDSANVKENLTYGNEVGEEGLSNSGRPVETLVERSILNNPRHTNPNKKYNVEDLINSSINTAPAQLRPALRKQFDEWVSPELRMPLRFHPTELQQRKVTLQEFLDDIGKNKPRIRENIDTAVGEELAGMSRYGQGTWHEWLNNYMPNIPPSTPAYNSYQAMESLAPFNYAERNFSLQSPRYRNDLHPDAPDSDVLFIDPGHHEVGNRGWKGKELQFDLDQVPADRLRMNTANRIFTTRSAMYDIDGKRVFIPAEGQSGIYQFGTSAEKAKYRIGELRLGEGGIPHYSESDLYSHMEVGRHPMTSAEHMEGQAAASIKGFQLPSRADLKESYRINRARIMGVTEEEYIEKAANTALENRKALDDMFKSHGFDSEDEAFAFFDDMRAKSSAHPQNTDELWNGPVGSYVYDDTFTPEMHERWGTVFDDFRTVAQDNSNRSIRTMEQLYVSPDITEAIPVDPPMQKEWFRMHMKTSLQDATVAQADTVRFPINDYALARQRAEKLAPHRARRYSDEYTPDPENPTIWTPSKKATNMGNTYKQRTEEGLKRIEVEYGVTIPTEEVIDENRNKFIEIILTPELKEAFGVLLMSRGGVVRRNRPLMPLKYAYNA